MKVKTIFIYAIILLLLNGCTTAFYSSWDSSTYDPSHHTFEIDSTYLANYGMEDVEESIKLGIVRNWMVDSLPYFYFYLNQESITIPTILLVYWIEFKKPNGLYNFKVSIKNNKIYQSLDSVSYTIYDSLGTIYYKGGYSCNVNLTEQGYDTHLAAPYNIKIKPKGTYIIYADIDLFFTDFNNRPAMQSIKKSRFKYSKWKTTLYLFYV